MSKVDVGRGDVFAFRGVACGYNDRWPCRWPPLGLRVGSGFRANLVFQGLDAIVRFCLGFEGWFVLRARVPSVYRPGS